MSTKVENIRTEINQLVDDGYKLCLEEMLGIVEPQETKDVGKTTNSKSKQGTDKKKAEILDKARAFLLFPTKYQSWYTATLPIIEQLLPDRYTEFVEYYRPKRKASAQKYSALDYSIEDYLLGLSVTRAGTNVFDGKSVFSMKFKCQVDILKSALDRLESNLSNIRGILQAELFDSELVAADELLSKGHLRAAGTLAGVTLERHFLDVLAIHKITIKKKNSTIGDLNDELKNANIIDVPQWRFIQRLGDIRNLCAHSKEREATREEVHDLLLGADKVIKTVA